MKKKQNVQISALLLLLTYIISHIPPVLYHHHKSEISPYQAATACEKVIYFSENNNTCHHKFHISKTTEKCSLCDKHIVSLHNFQPFRLHIIRFGSKISFVETPIQFFFSSILFFSNKSPPLVSSFAL